MRAPMSYANASSNLQEAILLMKEAAENHVIQYGADNVGLVSLIESISMTSKPASTSAGEIIEAILKEKAQQALFHNIRRSVK